MVRLAAENLCAVAQLHLLRPQLPVDRARRDREGGELEAVQNHSKPGSMNAIPSVLMTSTTTLGY